MYELLILTRLMHGPQHGYLIAKVANDIIGPWAKISLGTLYPLLAKLEQAGYIRSLAEEHNAAQSHRQSRTYEITPLGRVRFHQLMMDTASNMGDYQRVFQLLKVPYMEFLQPRERLHLLNHYINYCETRILFVQSEMQDLLQMDPRVRRISSSGLAATVDMMEHQVDQWQGEIDWARRLRERVVASIEADPAGISARGVT
ncbi:MAG TPA: PadR family transcriptional regulator [Ktedonobacteraceae bacterium]|nr:PadR family transcriptional regulator [Ktedonobacteraceae bacterium]